MSQAFVSDLRGLGAALPPPRRLAGAFSTEAFVTDALGHGEAEASQDWEVLDGLSKKVEVLGRVRAFYSQDLSRMASPEIMSRDYAPALCGLFLLHCQRRGDLKFLNTALKILDGVIRKPSASYPGFLRAWAEALVYDLIGTGHAGS